jgi:NAD(P)H-dependent FMN reductase
MVVVGFMGRRIVSRRSGVAQNRPQSHRAWFAVLARFNLLSAILNRLYARAKLPPTMGQDSDMTADRPVRILAISGSLRAGSYAYHATRYAFEAAVAEGAVGELLDLRTFELPFCDGREDDSTYPENVHRLRELVASADGLILGTPEYHNSYSGVIKNALDLVSNKHIGGKVCGLVSVAGGAMAMSSLSHLRIVLRAVHAWVIPQQAMIPQVWSVIDAEGAVTDEKILARLREVGVEVVAAARRLRSDVPSA